MGRIFEKTRDKCWRVFVAPEIKIENNGKKVLQNGCKYTQDSTTLLFSIDFIHLNALKFPKIVKIITAPHPLQSLVVAVVEPSRLQVHFQA